MRPKLAQDHVAAAYDRRATRLPVRARASNDATAMIVLDELCEERGGLPVNSPYSIARCQGARANRGFESERLICEGLADGAFVVTISSTHMNRGVVGVLRDVTSAGRPWWCRGRSGRPLHVQ